MSARGNSRVRYSAFSAPSTSYARRPLPDHRSAGAGRHGRGLPRRRPQTRPAGGAEIPSALLERFHTEARNARQVSHPNVCRVYDIGEMSGQQPTKFRPRKGDTSNELREGTFLKRFDRLDMRIDNDARPI